MTKSIMDFQTNYTKDDKFEKSDSSLSAKKKTTKN